MVTFKFLSLGKLNLKLWKRLGNHEVTLEFKFNISNFKANCVITTHLKGRFYPNNIKGKQ